jgi:hypothetical protein
MEHMHVHAHLHIHTYVYTYVMYGMVINRNKDIGSVFYRITELQIRNKSSY